MVSLHSTGSLRSEDVLYQLSYTGTVGRLTSHEIFSVKF
ncbi:hypothetical protein Salmuc_05262 [Salipiger mucosus DSM 16094]|uniref:Uncharacterized protein n=1 Tax=Salipiger mucosus DSM 16094 TaxID=1123237 RepID=S9QSB1_9RHOB|nr:hypothetical protein Salmuc_05262 [Salipiger mucosus DSM 16094]